MLDIYYRPREGCATQYQKKDEENLQNPLGPLYLDLTHFVTIHPSHPVPPSKTVTIVPSVMKTPWRKKTRRIVWACLTRFATSLSSRGNSALSVLRREGVKGAKKAAVGGREEGEAEENRREDVR